MDRFKLAVVGSDPERWVAKMFPDVAEAAPESETADDDLDLTDTEGTWVFEDENVTPEQVEETFAELVAEQGGVITFDDLPEEGWQ